MTNEKLVERFTKLQKELVLQSSDLSLRTIATMVDSGAIDVAPQFQRRDRWSAPKQSALIESFVVNIPVPPIYLAEDDLGTYSVIDGKQRITAIANYLDGSFALRGLTRFPSLDGHYFADLPRPIQNGLDMRPLRAVTLLKQSHPDLKYEVFHRLNTYGEVLNAQEIRNVVFRGPLNTMIYEASAHPFLQHQLKIREGKGSAFRNMLDAEWVLRFLTLAEVWGYFSGDLSRSMDDYMATHRDMPEPDLDEIKGHFYRALDACWRIWGEAAFKRPEGGGWRDQALAGMYDAQMVAAHMLQDEEIARLLDRSGSGVEIVRALFHDGVFEDAVRQGTNTPGRVKYRIGTLLGALQDPNAFL